MRVIAIVVVILGLASLVLGVLFITQATSGKQEVADSITPVTLDQLDATYDSVKAKQLAIKMAEEPAIQGGTALPSPMYNYLTVQKVGLGLARSQVGTANAVQTTGIISILVGLGLVLGGFGMLRKAQSAD